ncbi:MAG: GNAT family N-acetyltransferase [Bacteroidales bacterium]|nr:GNAT family N-acetyltransferase [Bacteroidales bacterium]
MLTHKGTQTIETSRLILRRAVRDDAEPMFRNWASDSEVTKYLTWPTYEKVETAHQILDLWASEYEKPNYYQWMIVLKELGEPIGSISVVRQNDRVEEAEIGYCIGSHWWHKGIMTEALNAVIEYLFIEVGMNRVAARHDPNNPHSGGVMRKCGMKYEGTHRACDRNNQGVCDAAQYAILRSEWKKPRHFAEGIVFSDDADLVQEVYRRVNEDSRLNKSQAARVEFLTTVRYIEKYLIPGTKILDVGAGAGEYSLYFARKGYQVSALELADANIAAFRAKMTDDDPIDLVQGNALDLSRYDSDSFDVVLLFGPLYHLHEEADKLRCIEEAKRVCKPNGKIFFAFISNDMVILTMQQCQEDYLMNGDYNKETFRLDDFPFVFHTPDHCRELLGKAGIQICHEVASDGASELLQDLVNSLDEASYQQYLRYHFYICEKPEFLGMSNHLLFVGR